MEIPFDRKIAEFYSRGELFAESIPEWKEKFITLYHDIEKIVQEN
jgi:MinD superfamily P-loop ATPase